MDQLAKSTDLDLAKAHARKIFKRYGNKTFAKWKPEPAILQWAANLLEDGQQLRPDLAKYVARALRTHQKKRGRKKETNSDRNSMIVIMVFETLRFGFEPTRTPDVKKHDCGCSIVAKVLDDLGVRSERGKKFSESAITKVWQNFNKRLQRDALVKFLRSPGQPEKTTSLFSAPPPGLIVGK